MSVLKIKAKYRELLKISTILKVFDDCYFKLPIHLDLCSHTEKTNDFLFKHMVCLQISIKDNDNVLEEYPGVLYTVKVLGEKNTHIGLLGVDQSVYLLRDQNRLTPESVRY